MMRVQGQKIGQDPNLVSHCAVGGPGPINMFVYRETCTCTCTQHTQVDTIACPTFIQHYYEFMIIYIKIKKKKKTHGSESNGYNHCIKSIILSFIQKFWGPIEDH